MAVRRSEICYTCRHWLGGGVRERGPKGQCRRYPPVVTDRAPAGVFPTTLSTDWCGEWLRNAGLKPESDPGPDTDEDVMVDDRPLAAVRADAAAARAGGARQEAPARPAPRALEEGTLYDDL
ncbi:hypothetical protein [Nitrospirillum sp. BR 11828]|uniref:hypothetical protein n=1 Tax=Nitrospirillum sp. BR 11828 TaxID=3104325 RepID=UPI002ACA61A3|nr:hypothetical protein [Nitrospirillum sp. BR 11828]MDZ5648687.1 hypothetical protein [Nitrospirillum sp. BR 11828]